MRRMYAKMTQFQLQNVCFTVPEPNCFNIFAMSAFNEPFDG